MFLQQRLRIHGCRRLPTILGHRRSLLFALRLRTSALLRVHQRRAVLPRLGAAGRVQHAAPREAVLDFGEDLDGRGLRLQSRITSHDEALPLGARVEIDDCWVLLDHIALTLGFWRPLVTV